MYSHCLFCSASLGANETLGSFPVGRRLAFDAARGRLWVVCPSCERWCLSPLEERWEAIEEAQRAFADSPRRASTDHIGLARTAEGTSLIRVGAPTRAEFAAWRYGDQFGRRRKRQIALTAGGVAVGAGIIIGGPVLGLWAAGAVNALNILLQVGNAAHQRRTVATVPYADGRDPLRVSRNLLRKARILPDPQHGWAVEVPYSLSPGWSPLSSVRPLTGAVRLTGHEGRRAAGLLLPHINRFAGDRSAIDAAVGVLEEARDPLAVFERAATNQHWPRITVHGKLVEGALHGLPLTLRLALEMASHEESERRALEGELAELERAWKDAEEIAAISDNLFVPSPVQGALARLRGAPPGRMTAD